MFYDLIIFGAAEVIMFEKMDLKKVKHKLTLSLHHVIIAYTAQMEKAERSEEGKSLTPLASNMIKSSTTLISTSCYFTYSLQMVILWHKIFLT